jgi:hypothetical protein
MAKILLVEHCGISTVYNHLSQNLSESLLTIQERQEVLNDGAVYLVGPIQAADTLNGNNRIYPRRVLEKALIPYQRLIAEGGATGELDHENRDNVNFKTSSHVLTSVWWNQNTLMGKIRVLETTQGNNVRALIKGGVRPGISSRALGSVSRDERGRDLVQDDLDFRCWDLVSTPSTPGAFMSVMESQQYVFPTASSMIKESQERQNKIKDLVDFLTR